MPDYPTGYSEEQEELAWQAALARYRELHDLHFDNPYTDLPHGLLDPLPEPMRIRWVECLEVFRRS